MLDSSIINHLKGLFGELEADYTLDIQLHPQSENRDEVVELISDVASCSAKIEYTVNDGDSLRVTILKDKLNTGISFRAIPNGHEFSSLILAILNADGKGKNFPDEFTTKRIKGLKRDIKLTTYLSLTCTNCPDVVQDLNIMALLNSNITHEGVDGAINQSEVERLNIKAVPTVFANGEILHIGSSTIGELLNKLEERFGAGEVELTDTKEYDIIVAGGGPAGVTAAVYSARKGLSVAVVAERIGGQVNETVAIENLITIPHTTGKELATSLRALLLSNGVDIYENRRIESFDRVENTNLLCIKGGESLKASQLIVATGAKWRRLNIDGEEEYIGRGVAFCPHCDGPLFRGRRVAVIGGGNSGVEAAIDLAGICSKVVIYEYMESLKADKVLVEKAKSISNIEIITNTETLQFIGNENSLTDIVRRDRSTGDESTDPFSGVFIQIGLLANSAVFSSALDTNQSGEIVISESGRTSLSGVYAAGDVTNVAYKQIIISMGEGAKAALTAFDDRIRE